MVLIAAGFASAAAAAVVSLVLTQLLPDDARRWGTVAFAALGAGLVLVGAGALLGGRDA